MGNWTKDDLIERGYHEVGGNWVRENRKSTAVPNRAALQTPYLEPDSSHEQVGKSKAAPLATRFRVKCHTTGKRLGDVDGRSVKAVFDAFTKAGIWPDDSAVEEVCFTQEKSDKDETIIIIETID